MYQIRRHLNLTLVRNAIQVALALFIIFAGWRFSLFVQHFDTAGAIPLIERPASVEAFLPMSALVALRVWIQTGVFDPIHPAALVILLAVLVTAWLFPKAICAWFCPIGTLSEGLWRFGQRVFGRNINLPRVLDIPLRSLKYLLLVFALSAVFWSMSLQDALFFQKSDYNKIADVKMLQFYLNIGSGTIIVLLVLGVASIFIRNFWCRYLCPYGALLGLIGMASPLAITRQPDKCTQCLRCSKVCPNRIDVAHKVNIISPECSSCLACIASCPRSDALSIRAMVGQRRINTRAFVVSLLVIFFGILLVAQWAGLWQTALSYSDYLSLIPQAHFLTH